MKFLEKLRALPENRKIIIFFVVMGIAALIAGFVGMRLMVDDLVKLKDLGKTVQLPAIEIPEELKNLGSAKDETAGWQPYANETYAYALTYPTEWFIDASNPASVYISSVSNEGRMVFEGQALHIMVDRMKTKSLVEEASSRFGKEGVDFTKEEMKIGGENGFIITSICEGVGCGAPEWVVAKNDYFYDITSGLDSTNQRPVFDRIISTFTFSK